MELDPLDKRILYHLNIDSRSSVRDIAKRVSARHDTVSYRIDRLVGGGLIKKFYSFFDMSKLGYHYYRVSIKLHHSTPDAEKRLAEFIRAQKFSANLRVAEGRYNVTFLTITKNLGELADFVADLKGKFGDYILEKDISAIAGTYIMNQRFSESERSVIRSIDHRVPQSCRIDGTDRELINTLAHDCRTKLTEIAAALGIDPKVVAYRIKRLEKEGIIVANTYEPDFNKFGLEPFQVNMSLKTLDIIPKVISFFESTNKCLFANKLIGKYDFSVELYVENSTALKGILEGFKGSFANEYNYYDVLQIFGEHVINWSPFLAGES